MVAKTDSFKKEKKTLQVSDLDNLKSTKDVFVSKNLIDQVVGQEKATELIRKAAAQKRNVLLIGIPGTGKSMIAQAMSEILPISTLKDVLIYPNEADQNNPKVKLVGAGQGRKILNKARLDAKSQEDNMRLISLIFPLAWLLLGFVVWRLGWVSDVIYAATLIVGVILFIGFALGTQIRTKSTAVIPKLLIDNAGKKIAPFAEATGARAGALLGDVRHDPLQSGGLGTPAHLRVEAGMIQKVNGGVLFIDEIATLSLKSQQELLTAMQEKKYSITGQSEMSSGAMTRTDPIPTNFVLIAAGNYEALEKVHPALRSRIRGYGYEIYMNLDMPDTKENQNRVVQFVAQEVKKDGKIPHFSKEAIELIIFEARRRAGRKNRLTLKLRDLGGLVRAAGDIAKEKGHSIVQKNDVFEAKMSARTLEQQMVSKMLEEKKEYDVYKFEGTMIGRVNGLAVSGEGDAGLILPLEAEVAPASSKSEGRTIATGKLGEIAREAVQNVSALIKKLSGKDISSYDVHIQFLQTYSGVEGDSASVSVATAVISSIEKIPVKQSLAMTGSLSIKGEVMPVGGITAKVTAAINAGFKEVIIPKSNEEDLVLTAQQKKKIKIIPVGKLNEVLNNAFEKGPKTKKFIKSLEKLLSLTLSKVLKENIGKVVG